MTQKSDSYRKAIFWLMLLIAAILMAYAFTGIKNPNPPESPPTPEITRLCENAADSQCWETEDESGPPVSWREKPKVRM